MCVGGKGCKVSVGCVRCVLEGIGCVLEGIGCVLEVKGVCWRPVSVGCVRCVLEGQGVWMVYDQGREERVLDRLCVGTSGKDQCVALSQGQRV